MPCLRATHRIDLSARTPLSPPLSTTARLCLILPCGEWGKRTSVLIPPGLELHECHLAIPVGVLRSGARERALRNVRGWWLRYAALQPPCFCSGAPTGWATRARTATLTQRHGNRVGRTRAVEAHHFIHRRLHRRLVHLLAEHLAQLLHFAVVEEALRTQQTFCGESLWRRAL